MLLNHIPVLDKGYVALIDSCNTTKKLRELGNQFFGGEYPSSLEELGSMTLAIKCPLFFQLYLSKFSFKIINIPQRGELDAYRPTTIDVRSADTQSSSDIADDISRTTDALLINPKAYQADGCDRFVSQLITPISTYTEIIVKAEYSEWCKLISQRNTPNPINSYVFAIEQVLTAEWSDGKKT
jgi:hypothetical protein